MQRKVVTCSCYQPRGGQHPFLSSNQPTSSDGVVTACSTPLTSWKNQASITLHVHQQTLLWQRGEPQIRPPDHTGNMGLVVLPGASGWFVRKTVSILVGAAGKFRTQGAAMNVFLLRCLGKLCAGPGVGAMGKMLNCGVIRIASLEIFWA